MDHRERERERESSFAHEKINIMTSTCNEYYEQPQPQAACQMTMIQNCLASTVVKAPKSSHITPILRSLHWLKI